MSLRQNDTIAAICTPPGEGGVAIVRVSGVQAKAIATALFSSTSLKFQGFCPHTLHFGNFSDPDGIFLDQGLCVYMPKPHSYTGEDTAEFHIHGGYAAPQAVLEAVLQHGARMAERGEFTLRAFLNGRLDLTQAEAVAELIHAPTKAALHLAQAKLSGILGQRITELRRPLEELRRDLTVAVDFPEDELECLPPDIFLQKLDHALAQLDALLQSVQRARAWREGSMVVLCGPVNSGKSSLLNAFLGKERAIVSNIPGTTRDYLEENINLDGLLLRLVDTAGLRATQDSVEYAGMEMSRALAVQADMVLFVIDGSRAVEDKELETIQSMGLKNLFIVINKRDKPCAIPCPVDIFEAHGFDTLQVSASTGQGLEDLGATIRKHLLSGQGEPDPDEAAPNLRQAKILTQAKKELLGLRQDLQKGLPPDVLGVSLESACSLLASLTGEMTPEEILRQIFEDFCIGK